MIAATQCRLDKEGATKLVCDLITSTKNEKIFQESIGLAIRLLDGGNTEIQVWRGRCARSLRPRGWAMDLGVAARARLAPQSSSAPGISQCHVALFSPRTPSLLQPGLSPSPTILPPLCPLPLPLSSVQASFPLLRPPQALPAFSKSPLIISSLFFHSLICGSNKPAWSTLFVPGTVLGAWCSAVNKRNPRSGSLYPSGDDSR